jgi:D-tyrosyl-tRNA(Tyr) deacylase
MKLVLQSAKSGSVTVDGEVVGEIGKGAVCLVGVHRDEGETDADWMVEKLLSTRLWPGDDGTPWQKTIGDIDGQLLLVSQFTLHARVSSGRRPDFSRAMGPDKAKGAFDEFVEKVKARYVPERVQTGTFGAMMDVRVVSDGNVAVTFDSFLRADRQ